MGYEIQLVVGKVNKHMLGYGDTKDKPWFSIYATVDLCKPGDAAILKLRDATKANPVYMYAVMGDGDTAVTEDRYGAPVVPIPIQDVLEALHADQRNDYYRRFAWAIRLLESMAGEDEELSVVLWGY